MYSMVVLVECVCVLRIVKGCVGARAPVVLPVCAGVADEEEFPQCDVRPQARQREQSLLGHKVERQVKLRERLAPLQVLDHLYVVDGHVEIFELLQPVKVLQLAYYVILQVQDLQVSAHDAEVFNPRQVLLVQRHLLKRRNNALVVFGALAQQLVRDSGHPDSITLRAPTRPKVSRLCACLC